jgi:hypothetical protein
MPNAFVIGALALFSKILEGYPNAWRNIAAESPVAPAPMMVISFCIADK